MDPRCRIGWHERVSQTHTYYPLGWCLRCGKTWQMPFYGTDKPNQIKPRTPLSVVGPHRADLHFGK